MAIAQRKRKGPSLGWEALPENTPYRDTGCDLHPTCLTCPFPRCRYDFSEAHGWKAFVNEFGGRNAKAGQLRREGKSRTEIAAEIGISVRTVHRIFTKEVSK